MAETNRLKRTTEEAKERKGERERPSEKPPDKNKSLLVF